MIPIPRFWHSPMGRALGNPGPGGYGVVLKYRGVPKELSKGYRYTTNNRMELMGAIVALETLERRSRVILATDSRYVVDGINKGWAETWRANGWRRGETRQGQESRSVGPAAGCDFSA